LHETNECRKLGQDVCGVGRLKQGAAILFGAILGIAAVTPACSAIIKSVPGKGGRIVIHLSGMIGTGDTEAFLRALSQAKAAGMLIEGVRLDSSGGKLGEGAKLAALIKSGKFPTVVESGAICASACFLAFAAGEPRFAGPDARIGVHKASSTGGIETKQTNAATVLMAHLAKELGVPTSIVNRMMTTPPTQIAWLDPNDLRAMGVKTLINGAQVGRAVSESTETAALRVPSVSQTRQVINRPSWSEFVEKTRTLSAEQNQGSAVLRRLCKPEMKECVEALSYQLDDGRQVLVMSVEDATGAITRREVCESNVSNNLRECVNWDTGARYRDIKDATGAWVQRASE
jgi:hypothetical protein